MARSNDPDVGPIYALHQRWLSDVLGSGGSLLTPGATVWDDAHLRELEEHFVGQPDTGSRRFLEKLHDQLSQASPEAVQLMAELHVVHFLIIWNGAISATKKRSDIDAILSWMPVPAAVPDDVAAALAPGIAHPGQWVMSRRDTQLTWLIRFARAWQALPADHQHELVADPWALKAFVGDVHSQGAAGARLALLHLAHPDTFEAIVSSDHKARIVDRFGGATGEDEDIDRRLLAARARLTPRYDERFNWYDDPLVHQWSKRSSAWVEFLGWLERFRALPDFDEEERIYKVERAAKVGEARHLALAGDPGWRDALVRAFRTGGNNLADRRDYDPFIEWLAADPDAGLAAVRALWAGAAEPDDRFRSFLDQVPDPVLGTIGKQLNIGAFLLMAENPTSLPPMTITPFRQAWRLAGWGPEPPGLDGSGVHRRALVFLDELVHDSAGWGVPLRDRLDAQGAVWALVRYKERPQPWTDGDWLMFTVWRATDRVDDVDDELDPAEDGGGPTDEVSLVDHIAVAAKDLHIEREVLDEIVELLEDKRQVVLYGPPGTGKTYLALRLAKAIAEGDEARVSIVQFHPATSYEDFFEGLRPVVTAAGQVNYERRPGPLVTIADAARADPERRYVLLIDEINRANLPKVFGELLFLLEYRTESARTLYRPEEAFRLPDNLWFIGTMNTADRSVALIDAAMRRRFHFVPFFPHDGPMKGLLERWLGDAGGRLGVAALLAAANAELKGLVGEHLLIGPSHFMKTDLSDRALERIWTYNVFPLIEEQLWGNNEQIDLWRWANVRKRFETELTGTPSDADNETDDSEGDASRPG